MLSLTGLRCLFHFHHMLVKTEDHDDEDRKEESQGHLVVLLSSHFNKKDAYIAAD